MTPKEYLREEIIAQAIDVAERRRRLLFKLWYS
jgi:hypothetical protein